MKLVRMLIFATVAAMSSAVQARIVETYDVAGWSVFAYTDDSTGAFAHCAVGSTYRSGIMLMFLIDSDKRWYMALHNSKWRLSPGRKYNFDIRLDRAYGENWFGYAASPQIIRVPLAQRSRLFQKFRRSHLLTIDALRGRFSFYLTGSSKALRALVGCALRYMQPGSKITNPFETEAHRPASAPASVANKDALYAEAAVTITNMLAESGPAGYRLLPISKVKSEFQGQHAVWTAGSAAGSLQIYTSKSSMDNVTAALIAKASAECKGKFATGKTSPSKNAKKVEVACEQDDRKVFTYFYVVIRRPAGGKYIFTVFNADDSPSSQSEASRVSDMILASQKR